MEIAITDSDGDDADSVTGKNSMRGQYSDQKHEISSMGCDEKNFEARQQIIETRPVSLSSKNSSTQHSTKSEDVHGCCNASSSMLLPGKGLVYLEGRPDIKKWILRLVEITGGETSVAVCGGKSLVAKVRNSVAGISDERAVHKGTGANVSFLLWIFSLLLWEEVKVVEVIDANERYREYIYMLRNTRFRIRWDWGCIDVRGC